LTAPCPTPGPAPDRSGHGRRQAAPYGPARPAPAGSGWSPLRPRSPRASSPSRPVFRPAVWQSLRTWCPGGRPAHGLLLLCRGDGLAQRRTLHGTLPHHQEILHQGALLSCVGVGGYEERAMGLREGEGCGSGWCGSTGGCWSSVGCGQMCRLRAVLSEMRGCGKRNGGLGRGAMAAPKENTYQGESWVVDSLEGVCAGRARFEYPATFVLFSNFGPYGRARPARTACRTAVPCILHLG
jgi:hypothetical protein